MATSTSDSELGVETASYDHLVVEVMKPMELQAGDINVSEYHVRAFGTLQGVDQEQGTESLTFNDRTEEPSQSFLGIMVDGQITPVISSTAHSSESGDDHQGGVFKTTLSIIKHLKGTMPDALQLVKRHSIIFRVMDICFRGTSQVFFINNPVSGLFILVAIGYSSWISLLYAVVGLISSTVMARILSVDLDAIYAGLYGYNGILVGLALELFSFGDNDSPRYQMLIPVALMAACTSLLMIAVASITVRILNMAPFTFPFQLATWMWLLAAQSTFEYFPVEFPSPRLANVSINLSTASTMHQYSPSDAYNGIFAGISQVFLVNNSTSGVIMIVGIFISSPISAVLALLGSFIGVGFSMAMGVSKVPLINGLYGYNPSLTAIAIGGMFYVPTLHGLFYTVTACAFTTILNAATSACLTPLGMPSLTFPFTMASWVFILVSNNANISNVIPVSLSMVTTPENHRDRYLASKAISVGLIKTLGKLPFLVMKSEEDLVRIETRILPVLLCHYASIGDLFNFKRILGTGPDISKRITMPDYDGRTPLMIASANSHVHFVKVLLSIAPQGINAKDQFGHTALDEAVSSKTSHLVRLLALQGARLGSSAKRRMMEAVQDDDIEVVSLLLEAKISVLEVDMHKRTALHLAACLFGRVPIMKLLISHGADCNQKDSHGNTALDDAKRSDQSENELFLTEVMNRTGLRSMRASYTLQDALKEEKYKSIVKTETTREIRASMMGTGTGYGLGLGLGLGMPLSTTRVSSSNSDLEIILPQLLCVSAARNSTKEMSFLLGVDDTSMDPLDVSSTESIDEPVNAPANDILDPLQFSLHCLRGNIISESKPRHTFCHVNRSGYDGRSPLAIAATSGSLDACKLLVENGADVNCQDRWGATPLWSAVLYGTSEVVSFLLSYGAALPDDPHLQFSLLRSLASRSKRSTWERLLLIPNFDFNMCDYDSVTAMHIAARNGEIESVHMLKRAGANSLATDRWNEDPKMYSKKPAVHHALQLDLGIVFTPLSPFTSPFKKL